MRYSIGSVLVCTFGFVAFGTGFTKFEITCEPKEDAKDNPAYTIHRYSMSAPGGPISNFLTINKTQGENEASSQVFKLVREEAGPRVVKNTLIYTQWLTTKPGEAAQVSGYIHVYGGREHSLLDIKIPGRPKAGSNVNTNGPVTDYDCKQTKPKLGLTN